MAIFVTGDTHGSEPCGYVSVDGFFKRLNTKNFPEQKNLTKEDFVVICGDFGGVWNCFGESKSEKFALDWLESKNFTTLFVPGNHENYDRLLGLNPPELIDSWLYNKCTEADKNMIVSGYPRKAWHNGMVRELRPSVLMLERGFVFEVNDKKCFAFGGAESHDISGGIIRPEELNSNKEMDKVYKELKKNEVSFRVNHISWWEQEMPSQMEMEMGWAMLEDEKYEVDFIFTHDAPSSVYPMIYRFYKTNELNRYLEKVKEKVKYSHWFFGHHHFNHTFPGGKDHALYEQIIQIA